MHGHRVCLYAHKKVLENGNKRAYTLSWYNFYTISLICSWITIIKVAFKLTRGRYICHGIQHKNKKDKELSHVFTST
jgi:hypothetical protein